MLNRAQIVGRLGADPEIRTAQTGTRFANFTVATSEKWKDKNGSEQERTEWHRISVMNDVLVDIAQKRLAKGSLVFIEGQLQTRKWTDNSGVERYTTEIVLGKFQSKLIDMGRPSGSGDPGYSEPAGRPAGTKPARQPHTRAAQDGWQSGPESDEIPF